MAFTKTYDLGGGVTLLDAYHRIERLDVNNQKHSDGAMLLGVAIYKNKAAREDPKITAVTTRTFAVAYPAKKSGDLYQQAYILLKSLPEYTGAIDA